MGWDVWEMEMERGVFLGRMDDLLPFFVLVSNTLAFLPFSCIEVGERKSLLCLKNTLNQCHSVKTAISKVHFVEVPNIVFDT